MINEMVTWTYCYNLKDEILLISALGIWNLTDYLYILLQLVGTYFSLYRRSAFVFPLWGKILKAISEISLG